MRLRHEFDLTGVLWFENPPAKAHARLVRAVAALGAASGIAYVLIGFWARDLQTTICYPVLLPLAAVGVAYSAFRRLRPMRAFADAPRRVGFTRLELHIEDARGRVERFRWRDILEAPISKDIGLVPRLDLRGPNLARTLRALNLDIGLKIRWAQRRGFRGQFEPLDLVDSGLPSAPLSEAPPGAQAVRGSDPPVHVNRDGLCLERKDGWEAFEWEDVDAVSFPVLAKDRLILAARGRHVSVILEPAYAAPFLEWLRGEPGRTPEKERVW